ncbi:lipid-binding SYLF domain-containing protein, partial [bacterium]|nr:lipid-binding SYLF domain-containing protein [bacterium]
MPRRIGWYYLDPAVNRTEIRFEQARQTRNNNMKRTTILAQAICIGILMSHCSLVSGQYKEEQTVNESIGVLNEIMSIPAQGIPRSMLHDAQAVAIFPGVVKASFVVGARHGNGVIMIRDDKGGWHAPVFASLTGGNIGWQVGVQSTDVVLVFKTRKSVNGLLSGRMTLGADAGIAAGPIGRQATAATDTRLGAQIYSYSRSRGLFAGVSFDGSVVRMDSISNATYYKATTPGGPVIIPASAEKLGLEVMRYAGNATDTPPTSNQVPTLKAST